MLVHKNSKWLMLRAQSTSKSAAVSILFCISFPAAPLLRLCWRFGCFSFLLPLTVPLHSLTLTSHPTHLLSPNAQSLCLCSTPSTIPPSLHVLGSNNTTLNLHLTDLCDRLLHARCLSRGITRPTPNLLLSLIIQTSSSFFSFFFPCALYFPRWADTNRKGCMQKREIGGPSQQALILRRTNDTIILRTDGE